MFVLPLSLFETFWFIPSSSSSFFSFSFLYQLSLVFGGNHCNESKWLSFLKSDWIKIQVFPEKIERQRGWRKREEVTSSLFLSTQINMWNELFSRLWIIIMMLMWMKKRGRIFLEKFTSFPLSLSFFSSMASFPSFTTFLPPFKWSHDGNEEKEAWVKK